MALPFSPHSSHYWNQAQAAAARRCFQKSVERLCDSILDAESPNHIDLIATRESYPFAVCYLDREVSPGCLSVLSVLYDRRSSRSLCVAIFQCLFGSTTIEATSADVDVITVDSFLERLADPTTRERALAGLALLGELSWREAPRKARAALLLRDLVSAMRARVS